MKNSNENSFTYSYGWLGYFLKYCGGIVLFLMALMFSALLILPIYADYYKESPVQTFLLAGACLVMAPACAIGAYYCIRYTNYFTCYFVFSSKGLSVEKKDTTQSEYSWSQLQSVTYRKFLKLFILDFGPSYSKIVLMNNGSYETENYNNLKDYLLEKPVTQKVMWL